MADFRRADDASMAHYEEIKDQLEAERLAQLAARQAEREAEQVTYYGLGVTSETLQQDEDDVPIILGLTTPEYEPYVNPYLEQVIDAWAESTPTSEADAAMRDYILRNRDSFAGFRRPDERPEVDLIYDNLTDEDKRTLNRIALVVAATAAPVRSASRHRTRRSHQRQCCRWVSWASAKWNRWMVSCAASPSAVGTRSFTIHGGIDAPCMSAGSASAARGKPSR